MTVGFPSQRVSNVERGPSHEIIVHLDDVTKWRNFQLHWIFMGGGVPGHRLILLTKASEPMHFLHKASDAELYYFL